MNFPKQRLPQYTLTNVGLARFKIYGSKFTFSSKGGIACMVIITLMDSALAAVVLFVFHITLCRNFSFFPVIFYS